MLKAKDRGNLNSSQKKRIQAPVAYAYNHSYCRGKNKED
jgi:hypothetical protein